MVGRAQVDGIVGPVRGRWRWFRGRSLVLQIAAWAVVAVGTFVLSEAAGSSATAVQVVYYGGVASVSEVLGGFLTVSSGGSAASASVGFTGEVFVAGGVTSGTRANLGGQEDVVFGSAVGTGLLSGGTQGWKALPATQW